MGGRHRRGRHRRGRHRRGRHRRGRHDRHHRGHVHHGLYQQVGKLVSVHLFLDVFPTDRLGPRN